MYFSQVESSTHHLIGVNTNVSIVSTSELFLQFQQIGYVSAWSKIHISLILSMHQSEFFNPLPDDPRSNVT